MDNPLTLLGALTVYQPWATAIVLGLKDVENRGWPFPYDTPVVLAVHAGLDVADEASVGELWPRQEHPRPSREAQLAYPRGAFLGTVVVTGSHPAEDCRARCSPWAWHLGHHWTLTDPRPLPLPLPATGRLRVWQPDPLHRAVLETVCLTPQNQTPSHEGP